MIQEQRSLPTWILVVSGLFAPLELGVSFAICFSPGSVLETVDLNAKGVASLVYIWASRQFAVGFILAFATIRRSIPMLTIAYLFLLVMFVGDVLIGISQKDNTLVISAIVMCLISAALLLAVNKRRPLVSRV